jgi:hypothetical protein
LTKLSAQTVRLAKNSIVALAESVDETTYDPTGSMMNTLKEHNWSDDSRLNKILSDLTVEEQNKVRQLLHKYKKLFIRKETNNIASNVVRQIDTGISKPIHCPPQRLGFKEREHVHTQVADMLKSNVI